MADNGAALPQHPWGDLVNYFRDASLTLVKCRLVAAAVNGMASAPVASDLAKTRRASRGYLIGPGIEQDEPRAS